jgi:tRNA A-37 threonylcarbamoyl transferase component Bud32
MPLPLPPPDRDGDGPEDQVSRVRMSGHLPDTTARELPHLPTRLPWGEPDDDDAESDVEFEDAFASLRGRGEPTHEPTQTIAEPTQTIAEPEPTHGVAGHTELDPHGATRPAVGVPPTPPARRVPDRVTIPAVRRTAAHAPVPPPQPPPAAARMSIPAVPPVPRTGHDPGLVGGRYQIVERIGQGGMGKVYKVVHAQLGKVFALKLIGEELAATGEARELFYREARLASSLSHPNVASVVDFGEDGKLGLFMVMELIEGEPLNKVLHRDGRLGVRQSCEIVLQVAEALHYIHGNDVVHCDIKTENILITDPSAGSGATKRRQLQVKLLDFGLARSLRTARITSSLSGTPHYVAPERIRGEPPSPAADIYGLGILFYEVLTGKVPWDGHVAQILAGHLEQAPTPPSKLLEGGLDPALEKLILRALAKTPAQRHKDMAAFIYELRTVMDMLGFGRRARRGGPRRVVIERTKNERDEMVRLLFEGCRLPLALIGATGLIVVANPAFARFVMGVDVEVEGLPVQSTPLVGAWDAFEDDLARAVGGQGVRRILEVDVPGGEVRRLLMWLDPGAPGGDYAVLGVQPLDL